MRSLFFLFAFVLFQLPSSAFSSVLSTYEGRIGKTEFESVMPKLHHKAGDLEKVRIRKNPKAYKSYFNALMKSETLGDQKAIIFVPQSIELAKNLAGALEKHFVEVNKKVEVVAVTDENTLTQQQNYYRAFMQENDDPMILISIHLPGVNNLILSQAKSIYLMRKIREADYLVHLLKHGFINKVREGEDSVWDLYDIGGNAKNIDKVMEYDLVMRVQEPYEPKQAQLELPASGSNTKDKSSKVEADEIGTFTTESQDYFRAPNENILKIFRENIGKNQTVTMADIHQLPCIYDHIPKHLKKSQEDLCAFVLRNATFATISSQILPIVDVPAKDFKVKEEGFQQTCMDIEWIRPRFSRLTMQIFNEYIDFPLDKKMQKTIDSLEKLEKRILKRGYKDVNSIYYLFFLTNRRQSVLPDSFQNSSVGQKYSDIKWVTTVFGLEYLLPKLYEVYANLPPQGMKNAELASLLSSKEIAFLLADLNSGATKSKKKKALAKNNQDIYKTIILPNLHPNLAKDIGRIWSVGQKVAQAADPSSLKNIVLAQLNRNQKPRQEFLEFQEGVDSRLFLQNFPKEMIEKIPDMMRVYYSFLTGRAGMQDLRNSTNLRENIVSLIYPSE